MFIRKVAIIICLFTLLSVACAQSVNDTQDNSKNQKLDSVLSGLLTSENPQEFAQINDLYIIDGSVRVVVELSDEKGLLPDYIKEETRYKNNVQVLVPIQQLTALSRETNVIFIRPPLKPRTNIETPPVQTPASGFNSAILLVISIMLLFILRKKGAL